ncbi:MAG TPA: AsmA family protein, partial [Bordetella sp.]
MIRKHRAAFIAVAALFALLALLIAGAVAAVTWVDLNRFKPQIESRVSAALGRPFAIRGDLSVAWAREPATPGWRGWVPWPRVSANDITLGNADWAQTPVMASLKRVQFGLSPLPLLAHR